MADLLQSEHPVESLESAELVESGCQPPPSFPDPKNMAPTPPNQFVAFTQLPPEMQTKIWKEAYPPPRIIRWHKDPPTQARLDAITNYRHRVPGVTLASRNSRYEALKLFNVSAIPPDAKGLIYFNHATDAIYFPNTQETENYVNANKKRYRDKLTAALPTVVEPDKDISILVLRPAGIADLRSALSNVMNLKVFRNIKTIYIIGDWSNLDPGRSRALFLDHVYSQYVYKFLPQRVVTAISPRLWPAVQIDLPNIILVQEDGLWPGDDEITFDAVHERVRFVQWGQQIEVYFDESP